MLIALSIRNFVLVNQLDLDLSHGFTSLTGETGAGKSILLAAISFALGAKTSKAAIRKSADMCSVTATFELPAEHPARQDIIANDIPLDPDEAIVIRRVLKKGGTARGYINDAPVSARLLQKLSDQLIEIHGQHASQSMLQVAYHKQLLDLYAETDGELNACRTAWDNWQTSISTRRAVEERLARAQSDRDYLAHAVDELDKLAPEEGEADALAEERIKLQSAEKVAHAVDDALKSLDKANPEQALSSASRSLGRAAALPVLAESDEDSALKQSLIAAADAIERALIEAGEAYESVVRLRHEADYSPEALEQSEARLFALRAAARKYDVDVAQLSDVRERMRMQLDEIEHSDQVLLKAQKAEKEARHAYVNASEILTQKRKVAATSLAAALKTELKPLKLERAEFRVTMTCVEPEKAGPEGRDRIAFEVRTNPGADFGPLHKIASGGEVARFSLAMKVCLVKSGIANTLLFDEADVGVGGAVAAAIGERLSHLAKTKQVLAITHSPQVASMADQHWRISKAERRSGQIETRIDVLQTGQRQEEIARMLAGVKVTKEARAAAEQLLAHH